MPLFVLGKDLNLNEVLVCFEEGELLEETPPRDRIVPLPTHQLVCDHARLLHLREHDISRRHRNVVSGVHSRERRRNDREEIATLVRLIEKLLVIDREADTVGVITNLTQVHRVAVFPVFCPVIFEEGVKQLARLKFGVHFTDVCDKDRVHDTTAIAKDVGVDAAIFGPKLNATQRFFEIFCRVFVRRDVFKNGFGDSAAIQ